MSTVSRKRKGDGDSELPEKKQKQKQQYGPGDFVVLPWKSPDQDTIQNKLFRIITDSQRGEYWAYEMKTDDNPFDYVAGEGPGHITIPEGTLKISGFVEYPETAHETDDSKKRWYDSKKKAGYLSLIDALFHGGLDGLQIGTLQDRTKVYFEQKDKVEKENEPKKDAEKPSVQKRKSGRVKGEKAPEVPTEPAKEKKKEFSESSSSETEDDIEVPSHASSSHDFTEADIPSFLAEDAKKCDLDATNIICATHEKKFDEISPKLKSVPEFNNSNTYLYNVETDKYPQKTIGLLNSKLIYCDYDTGFGGRQDGNYNRACHPQKSIEYFISEKVFGPICVLGVSMKVSGTHHSLGGVTVETLLPGFIETCAKKHNCTITMLRQPHKYGDGYHKRLFCTFKVTRNN